MALLTADRVKETTTTAGTGTYNLGGAATGFRTFVAGIGTTNSCYYCVTDGTDWEVGIGVVTDATPDTLSRTVILSSSNAGAAVNWSAGTKDVFVTEAAQRSTLPGCSVSYAGSDLNPAAGSSTAVPYDTETQDTHGFHDTGTNPERFTVPTGLAGMYKLSFHQRINEVGPTGEVFAWIRKNGSTTVAEGMSHIVVAKSYNYLSGCSASFRLADGDYVELLFYIEGASTSRQIVGGTGKSGASFTREGD